MTTSIALPRATNHLRTNLKLKHQLNNNQGSIDSKLLLTLMKIDRDLNPEADEIYKSYQNDGGSSEEEATIKKHIKNFVNDEGSGECQLVLREKRWQIAQLANWMQRLDPRVTSDSQNEEDEYNQQVNIIYQFSQNHVINVYQDGTKTPREENESMRAWVQPEQWNHGSRNYMEGVERAAYHYAHESRQGTIDLFTITDGILRYRNYAFEAGIMDTCFYLLAACPNFKLTNQDQSVTKEDYIDNRHLRAMQCILSTMDRIKEEKAETTPDVLTDHLLLYALTLQKLETLDKPTEPLTFRENPSESIKLMLRMIQRHPELLLKCLQVTTPHKEFHSEISHLKNAVRNYRQSRPIYSENGTLFVQKRWYEKIAEAYVNLHDKISSSLENLSLGKQEGVFGIALSFIIFMLRDLLKCLLFFLPSPKTAAQRGRLWSYGAYMHKNDQYLKSIKLVAEEAKKADAYDAQNFLEERLTKKPPATL